MSSADVHVLGAGPAGLIAGWHAARRGHTVTIVEQAPVVGGMAGSFEVAGQRVDHGSHRLHPSIDPGLLAELRGLLGSDLQERPRRGRIRLADRWIAFPLRATDLVRRLPASFALRSGRDAITRPFRRARADTYAEEVRAGLGPTMAEAFYEPYARKLWDTDPCLLSADLARRRIGARSPAALLRRLVDPTITFLYPRRGYGQISEALAGAAAVAGAELRVSTPVEVVRPSADRHTWSTIPLTTLARLTAPPGPDVALDHRGLVLVYLVVDRPQYTVFDAHYFPGLDTPLSRLSEPKNYRDNADDPSDRTVLCAEVPCWVGDEVWSASPDDLAGAVAEALERDGLPAPMHVAAEVRRLPRVYPVYRVGYEVGLADLDAWLESQPNLISLGRQGRFAPDNLHHVLAMGRDAAAALGDDGRFDVEEWRRARERFAEHVVED